MWESAKSWLIVVGVIAVLCMVSFLFQGDLKHAGWCAGAAAVCAILLADGFVQPAPEDEGEEP